MRQYYMYTIKMGNLYDDRQEKLDARYLPIPPSDNILTTVFLLMCMPS